MRPPPNRDEEKGDKGAGLADKDENEDKEPLDLSVKLITRDGIAASLPLSLFGRIPPVLQSRFSKLWNETRVYGKNWEPTLQTFELPLKRFTTEAPGFDPRRLKTVQFIFDRTPRGVIIVDAIGFSEPSKDEKPEVTIIGSALETGRRPRSHTHPTTR